ncbi:MAG: hypothetical protein LW704_04850 [Cryomorphaceae bacterium]|jgi:hypothetical protein|nr:hypothetical protein [Cryomorphaceae bacterium]
MKQFFLFMIVGLMLNSCIKNNPDPSWIEITPWTLVANSNSQYPTGELTHSFSDAWVYVNDELIGVFQVTDTLKIPVLKSGAVNIKIYPAIRNNGVSATKKIYPFVERYEINTTLVQNQTLQINPVTRYSSMVRFAIEDFEDPAIKIVNDPNSATQMSQGNDPAILQWGNFYGFVNLNETDSTWVAYTNFESVNEANLPRGEEVYLEIDYYNTNNVVTGLLWISSSSIKNNTNYQLNDQDPSSVKWKKIYIDLKELVSNSPAGSYFEQSFQAILDKDDTEGLIVIDNIKVVHF